VDKSRKLLPLTRAQISVGVTLRVIATRWDRPVGTIATVTDMGVLFVGDTWWFTVEWLTHLPKRGSHSLRMFEEDVLTSNSSRNRLRFLCS
jgi:hypothetical protein